ncbi:hypothetical protein Bbelb_388270 [Branchiostoma belcheri]|nr:hypothetical protein Bbelb_388270 [Branchiostoma belcheri]
MEDFIVENYVNLTARLDVRSVLPYLIQGRVVTFADRQRILHKDTGQDQAEELLDTISRTGKCTPKLFMNVLEETHQTALIDSLKSESRIPYVEKSTSLNVLPSKLQLEFVQKAKNKLLRKADKLFDHRTLKDKKRLKRAKRQFRDYKAIIESIIPEGCFILNLRFLQPCDVDDFYHDHFRVGPGSLSAALSDILITDEMRAAVGGEELMVRLEVRYDDYIRVRRGLCTTGLKRSTSVDNLSSTILQPGETDSLPLLNSLDLATTSTQDSSFTHWVNNPYSRQLGLVVRKKTVDARKVFERKHEIAKHQMGLQEDMVRSLQREVTRLTQEKDTAQKLLLDNMKDAVDKLLADHEKTNKPAMVEGEGQGKPHKQDLEAGQGKTKMPVQETSGDEILQAFSHLSSKVRSDWKNIAKQLGLNTKEIGAIEASTSDEEEEMYNTLVKWREKKGKEATLPVLAEQLKYLSLHQLVDELDITTKKPKHSGNESEEMAAVGGRDTFQPKDRFPIIDFEQLFEQSFLGTGGFAYITKAYHRNWRQEVAVKRLSPRPREESEREELYSEVRKHVMASRSDHVLSLLGVCPEPNLAIVMPYMKNGNLADLLQDVDVPWALRWRMAHEISLGMTFLHSLDPQIIHCDLKAQNVLFDDGFHAKIYDFGLSKWRSHSKIIHDASPLGWTVRYAAPELLEDPGDEQPTKSLGDTHLQTNYEPTDKSDIYRCRILYFCTG